MKREALISLRCVAKHAIKCLVAFSNGASKCRGLSPGFSVSGGELKEISVFADESGEPGTRSKYYLLTLVFHNQMDCLDEPIRLYEQALRDKGLPDIPLHTSPLMHGHEDYEGMSLSARKALLSTFFVMLQHMPIRYETFVYDKSEFQAPSALEIRMKRDIVTMIFDQLDYFQGFDLAKIYYDDGQKIVTSALHDAMEYALSKNALLYRDASPTDYRLSQAADLICAIELGSVKMDACELTKTDEKIFGMSTNFKKNWLKSIRKKRLF